MGFLSSKKLCSRESFVVLESFTVHGDRKGLYSYFFYIKTFEEIQEKAPYSF